MSKANEYQVDGNHYASPIQHWDYVVANELDYFQAQITRYVTRHKKKAGIKDLQKALHFLEKYIELEKAKVSKVPQPLFTGNELLPINSSTTGQENPFGFNPTDEK